MVLYVRVCGWVCISMIPPKHRMSHYYYPWTFSHDCPDKATNRTTTKQSTTHPHLILYHYYYHSIHAHCTVSSVGAWTPSLRHLHKFLNPTTVCQYNYHISKVFSLDRCDGSILLFAVVIIIMYYASMMICKDIHINTVYVYINSHI